MEVKSELLTTFVTAYSTNENTMKLQINNYTLEIFEK